MKNMKLMEYGSVLSGRTLGEKVAREFLASGERALHLDFKDVRSFTISFVSQLLGVLMREGFCLENVTYTGITDAELKDRFDAEMERLSSQAGAA